MIGVGFDRTPRGSDAVRQYAPPVRARFASRDSGPTSFSSGSAASAGRNACDRHTLWEELVRHSSAGVDSVRAMQRGWHSVRGAVDGEWFADVESFLAIQEREARWWRDAVLQYFQTFSRLPIPAGFERPAHPLDFYLGIKCPLDRQRPRCNDIQ